MKILKLSCLLLLLFFGSCEYDEFSPNQKFNGQTPRAVNQEQISKLSKQEPGETLRIAVSGDTQRRYKESEEFVAHINSRNDIDFVVLNGDVSDFGLLLEFQGIYKLYSQLKVPFITVIGNHDQVANGYDIYQLMFGSTNFSFSYGGIKFICHDSNSREHAFDGTIPDLNWLSSHLVADAGQQGMIAFSHVPPTDADFDQKLRKNYEKLMNEAPGMLASVHSHQHSPNVIYKQDGAGVPFIITNAIVNRAYTVLTIENGTIDAKAINF